MYKLLLLFILSLSITHSFACEFKTSKSELAQIVAQVQHTYYPELSHTKIDLREFTSDAYFLQAKPDILSLLKKKRNRQYFVEVNTKLYDCAPSPLALEAIIAHELEHIVDYENKHSLQIAGLGISYASKKHRARYERQTDIKVLYKGLGRGLIEYRQWIYQQLTPKQLATKKKFYLTPEEIENFQY
jgi:hypothetical protein